MAKVMISFPDDLLDRVDAQAKRRGMTRSGLLQQLAEQELTRDQTNKRQSLNRLLSKAGSHGGNNASHIREQRLAR